MATGKQGFVRAAEPQHSVSMQRGKEMRVQAPLTAMYLQPMPGLPTCSPAQPAAMQDAAVIPLPLPVMCSNQALPILTLHIAGGAAVQQQRPDTPVTSPRPKSAGKHVCPHCGRDCLKPSVLEKHLRCHTGERPYPCTTCGISFKTQSNLYKHKRTQAHARLSSESGKGAFSSQESTESSRETCSSPSLELQSEESGDVNKSESVVPAVTVTTFSSTQVTLAEGKPTSDTEWALRKAAVVGLVASPVHGQQEILNSAGQRIQLAPNGKNEATSIHTKSPAGDGRAPLTPNRTPLQRQEALFPKLSRGKSQSYDSTDSGFSESSEQHLTSSPGDTLHESMESLPEASMELQEPESSNKPSDVTTDDAKSKVSVQEKQKLEEHILKLISENSVLVDDKHLVNVRPRKTVLSKQGSIDLPMPYTYKDSFHFEMRSSKHQVSSLQTPDRKGRVVYSSVPTQHSTNLEHAPLTRSSSLPFSVGIQNNDRTAFSYQGDSIPLSRRCSAGNICPFKSVDQHAPHRSLVRQVAVDCLSIAEGLSTERSSHSSLSSDGDCGDTSTESGVKRCRRKKAQKFAYNKWYMYGGGTFKKLYSTEKDSLLKSRKTAPSLEQTESQGIQISQQRDNNSSGSLSFISCSAASLPPAVNVFTAQTSSQVVPSYVLLQSPLMEQTTGQMQHGSTKKTDDQKPDLNTETTLTSGTEEKNKGTETQFSRGPIPSERKKPKTEDDLCARMENTDLLQRQKCVLTSRKIEENTNLRDVISQSLQSVCGDVFQASNISALDTDNRLNIHRKASFSNPSTSNHSQLLFKRHSSPLFGTNVSGASGSPSASSSISVSQAKTSFLPKYQLKIPCSTDGVSDPCVSNHSSLDQSSLSQTLMLSNQSAQQCDPGPSTSSTTQNHLATTMMSYGQEQQGTSNTASITMTKSTTPVVCTEQNASEAQTHYQPNTYTPTSVISVTPTLASLIPEDKHVNMPIQNQCTTYTIHSKVGASTPSVLSQPLQTFTALGQNQSVVVGTTHSLDSSLSHSPTSTKPIHISATTMGSAAHNSPVTSAAISRQQPGPTLDKHATACQSSTESIPVEISHTAFQGAQFEGKMLLVNDSQSLAQDTFYVRTADLQIVMQLISDEQLALIEPQIEKQAFPKLDGSHSLVNKNPENSLADTKPTGVPQGIHKQCPGHTGTKLCMEQGNVNLKKPSEISDITRISVGSTDTNETKGTKSLCNLHPQNIYLTDSCPKGVISSLGSNIEHHVLAAIDPSVNMLQQQSTLLSPEHVDSNALKGLKLAGCCQDTTDNLGATDTSIASLSKPETSTESRSMLSKDIVKFFPEVPETSKIMLAGQHNSLHPRAGISKTAQGEMVQTKAESSCVFEAPLLQPASFSSTASNQEEPLSIVQPSQPKSCWLSCTSAATERHISTESVLTNMVCQYKPLNQRGVSKMDTSKLMHEAQGNQAYTPSQASVHLSQQHCSTLGTKITLSNREEVTALAASTDHVTSAYFESDKPVSESIQEKSINCGEASCGLDPVNQDLFTGPRVGGSLQSSQLQREARTGSQGWVPQEPESGGGDGVRVGNKCMEQEDCAKEDEREGATETHDGYQTATEPHSHVSQPVTNACHNTSSSAELDTSSVSGSATTALCGATSLSHDSTHVGQRAGTHPDNSEQVKQSDCAETPKLIDQSEVNVMERVPLECQERFTLLSSVPSVSGAARHLQSTCGHLLAHPLLVNAIQKEVQKETQAKNSATLLSHANASQMQGPLSENKSDKPFMTSTPCNADSNQTINTTLTQNNLPCPKRTNSNAMHSYQPCASTAHHTPIEPNAPQCHSGGSYLEGEESSSSSDDEGKLVIELE
ncbi:zinc finger protein 831 isoform X1 [Salminus brasiliensis]|uniref:zinc finger protein 831 isoform X1 n=1 Tax=Salminus brasiliensis TaxID=930266 RepID=UPI003B83911B